MPLLKFCFQTSPHYEKFFFTHTYRHQVYLNSYSTSLYDWDVRGGLVDREMKVFIIPITREVTLGRLSWCRRRNGTVRKQYPWGTIWRKNSLRNYVHEQWYENDENAPVLTTHNVGYKIGSWQWHVCSFYGNVLWQDGRKNCNKEFLDHLEHFY